MQQPTNATPAVWTHTSSRGLRLSPLPARRILLNRIHADGSGEPPLTQVSSPVVTISLICVRAGKRAGVMYPLGVLPCAPSCPLSSFPVVSSCVISAHTHVSAFYPVDFESNSSSNQCPSLGLALSLLAPAPVICSPDQAHDASTDLSCAQGHHVTWTTHASFLWRKRKTKNITRFESA